MSNEPNDTESIAFIVDAVSTKNLGLKAVDNGLGSNGWFNYGGIDRQGMTKTLADIKKGQLVEVLVKDGKFTSIINVQEMPEDAKQPGPAEHTERGKKTAEGFLEDYVTFEMLLEKLKDETGGKYSIETKILAYDMDKGYAIAQAHVKGEFGEVEREQLVEGKTVKTKHPNARWATCHGDCTMLNGGLVKQHFIRMAETRAMARALRAILGIGKTAEEEKS